MITRFLTFVLLALPAFSQNTARYPVTITTMQDLAFARDAPNKSQLTASINSVTLTATVADGTLFRPFNLLTFSDTGEQVMVCTVLVNDLQLCGRGFAGTSATFHSSGVILSGNVTAWHHNQLAAEVIAIQSALGTNLSNIPTPSWATLSGRPTALSAFTNDLGFLTSVAWTNVSGRPTTLSQFTNNMGFLDGSTLNTWQGSANIVQVGALNRVLKVTAPYNVSDVYAIQGTTETGTGNSTALYGLSNGTTSASNTGLLVAVSGSTGFNYGIKINVPLGALNYALYSNTFARSWLQGNLSIGQYMDGAAISPLRVIGIPVYSNNTTALAGGLGAGEFYRTGALIDQLCVVH